MWGIVIGLIERWWREKPRKDVVFEVVRLRDAMIECQRSYVRYKKASKEVRSERLPRSPYRRWVSSVIILADRLEHLDGVLSIFSPEAHAAIKDFSILESREVTTLARLEMTARALQEPLDLDIKYVTMNAGFTKALDQLRTFIAANFKPEEIHKALNPKS